MKQGLSQVDHKHQSLVSCARAQVVNILKITKLLGQNFSKEEKPATKESQSYDNYIMINVDKRNCAVILDRVEYHKKF